MKNISEMNEEELCDIKSERENKCGILKENAIKIFTQKFHTPLFIIYAALLTFISFTSLIGMINKNWFMVLCTLPMTITAIISAVWAWRRYFSKEDIITINDMNGCSAFIGYMYIITILICVGIGLICLGFLFGSTLLNSIFSNMGNIADEWGDLFEYISGSDLGASGISGALSGIGVTIFIVVLLFVVAIMTIFINIAITFNKDKQFISSIKEWMTTGTYENISCIPTKRSYIFGFLYIVFAFLMKSGGVIMLIQNIAIGGYIIITAIFFDDIHKSEIQNQKEFNEEVKFIKEIDNKIDILQKKEENEKRDFEYSLNQQQQILKIMQMIAKNGEIINQKQTGQTGESKELTEDTAKTDQ